MKNRQLATAWNALEAEGFEVISFEYRGDELSLKVRRTEKDGLSEHLQSLVNYYGKEGLISAIEGLS